MQIVSISSQVFIIVFTLALCIIVSRTISKDLKWNCKNVRGLNTFHHENIVWMHLIIN